MAKKEKELEEERIRQVEREQQKLLEEERTKKEQAKQRKDMLEKEELEIRNRILKNIQLMEEKKKEKEREELRKKLSSGSTKLKSAVVMKRWSPPCWTVACDDS